MEVRFALGICGPLLHLPSIFVEDGNLGSREGLAPVLVHLIDSDLVCTCFTIELHECSFCRQGTRFLSVDHRSRFIEILDVFVFIHILRVSRYDRRIIDIVHIGMRIIDLDHQFMV